MRTGIKIILSKERFRKNCIFEEQDQTPGQIPEHIRSESATLRSTHLFGPRVKPARLGMDRRAAGSEKLADSE
jgi:hypothetical protein